MSQPPPMSAAIGYVALLEGTSDACLFWRTYPWDHAPGSLLLEESGGAVRRLDGAPYLPGSTGRGLLCVRDARTWEPLRQLVLGDGPL
jgi:fructose-1,6-bisphosphatase/inositol monophosphatase family enzyme